MSEDFETSTQVFESSGGVGTVSELHGLIFGMACLSADPGQAKSSLKHLALDYLGEGSEVGSELERLINQTYDELLASLEAGTLDFRLLLPADCSPVYDRIEGLVAWCRGFLMGLVASGVQELSQLPGDGSEIANDLLQISEAVADEEESEKQEKDLFEIQEYIRVGVQTLYDEACQTRQPGEQLK